ncbi:MAG: hypothetical protein J6U66_00820, partial [Lachnospiraceae bacterium]|nr:hypothetical protein [Lachnospiraceae bacterium]
QVGKTCQKEPSPLARLNSCGVEVMEKELLQEIEEAQMVLVGFGEALDAVEFQKMESYAESALNEVGVAWLAPLFWERLREDIY